MCTQKTNCGNCHVSYYFELLMKIQKILNFKKMCILTSNVYPIYMLILILQLKLLIHFFKKAFCNCMVYFNFRIYQNIR